MNIYLANHSSFKITDVEFYSKTFSFRIYLTQPFVKVFVLFIISSKNYFPNVFAVGIHT